MVKVLGFGIGVFILAFLWTIALIASVLLARSQGIDGAIGPIAIAILTSLILIFFPRESPFEQTQIDVTILDYAFIGRMLLVVAMCLILLVSLLILIFFYWSRPITAKPVNKLHHR